MGEHNHRSGRTPRVRIVDRDAADIRNRAADRATYEDPGPASLLSRVREIFLALRLPLAHRKSHLCEATLGSWLRSPQLQSMGRALRCSQCPLSPLLPGAQFQGPGLFAYLPRALRESFESSHLLG